MSDVMQKDEFHGLMQFVYQGNILVEEELTEENDENGGAPLAQRLLWSRTVRDERPQAHCREFCMEEILTDMEEDPKCVFLQESHLARAGGQRG